MLICKRFELLRHPIDHFSYKDKYSLLHIEFQSRVKGLRRQNLMKIAGIIIKLSQSCFVEDQLGMNT
jgi:hypothetical protein